MIRLPDFVKALLPGALLLLAWEFAVTGNQRLEFLFASPSMMFDVARQEIATGAIWHDCAVTLIETLLGLFFGTVLGTFCGLLLWGDGKIDKIARPYVAFFGAIPVFALAPMLIIWFGTGLLSKAVMSGFAVFFISLVHSYEGAHATAARYLGFANRIKAPHWQAIRRIVIPGSWQWILSGFRINVGLALMGAFIAEFVSSERGLGHYILKAGSLYDMPRVLFGLLLICLIAISLTAAANRVRK